MNKMQEELRRRNVLRTWVVSICTFVVVVSLFSFAYLPKAFAAGENDVSQCPDVTTITGSASASGYIMWIAGSDYTGAPANYKNGCHLAYPVAGILANTKVRASVVSNSGDTGIQWSPSGQFNAGTQCYYVTGGVWTLINTCLTTFASRNFSLRSTISPLAYEEYRSGTTELWSDQSSGVSFGSWSIAADTKIYSIYSPPPNVSLTVLSAGPYVTNNYITFHVSYHGIAFTPAFVNFYASTGATLYTQYPFFASTNSGTIDVQYRYAAPSPTGQPYTPFVRLTNFGTGSVQSTVNPSLTVVSKFSPAASPLDTSTLNADRINILDGEYVHFTWQLAGSWCTGSSVSQTFLYRGYPQFQSDFDTPINITFGTSSGSVQFRANSIPYYPYISVGCANGTTEPNLYIGGRQPVGITVLTAAEQESVDNAIGLGNSLWLNGGGSSGFWTGSGGYALWSARTTSARYQTVPLKWSWSGSTIPGFSVSTVYVYPDPVKMPGVAFRDTSTGATVAGIYHFKGIVYSVAGQYQPAIELRSASYSASNSSTFKKFYIGGGLTPNPLYVLNITNDIWGAATNTGSGSVTCGSRGVFGLSPDSFTLQLSGSSNPLITTGQEFAGRAVSSLLWLGGNLLCVLDNAPLLSTVHELVSPGEGKKYIPVTIGGKSFLRFTSATYYDLHYASDANHLLVWGYFMPWIRLLFYGHITWLLMTAHKGKKGKHPFRRKK